MNTKTNITEQYNKYRNEILDVFREAQPVLNRVKAKLVKGNFELPTEKLENEKFTLTLVGCFQSGKSTLFSYLCGGWELSKVGAGLRTTGCCVTATALPEGDRGYAEVAWFSEDEIKEAISDYTKKDANDIHLNDSEWCREFEQKLLRESALPEGKHDHAKIARFSEDEVKEPINDLAWKGANDIRLNVSEWCRKFEQKLLQKQSRIQEQQGLDGNTVIKKLDETHQALLMLHFFNAYKERCRKAENVRLDDVEKAVPYACYPDKWEQTWRGIKSVSDLDRAFKPEGIGFVFCKQIDYYIDSPHLRALGCTIQDCPGMFASKRDSDLAREIIRKSDAILCTFPGDKGLSAEEQECINECKAIGVTKKIFFGVNLHKPLHTWEEVIKPEVEAMLQNMDIKKEITHYHAPLALRCSELLQLLHGDGLHQVSKNAIQNCIEASSKLKSSTLEEYLRNRVDYWIRQIDDGQGDCFAKYCDGGNIRWKELDELHHVPALIDKLKKKLLPGKMRSILLGSGLFTACDVVDRLIKRLKDMVSKLSSEKQQTDDEIQARESKLKEFEEKRKSCDERLDEDFEHAIRMHLDPGANPEFNQLIQSELDDAESKIIDDIVEKFMHGSADFGGKEEKRRAFAVYLQSMVRDTLVKIRDYSLSEMIPEEIESVQKILRMYTEEIREMVAKTLEGVELQPPPMKEYGQEHIEQIPVPFSYKQIDTIFEEHEKSTLRQLLDYLFFGLPAYVGEEERAREIWGIFRPGVIASIKEALREMLLDAADSPLQDLEKYISSVKNKCDGICEEYREDLKTEQVNLRKSASKKRKEKEEYDDLEIQLENVRNDFDEIAGKVRKDF